MNRPEILAPAGSRESLEAAVRAGADAVYLGGTRFSARGSAENFSDGALKSAVAYCHIRGVKVYLAENILLYEKELPAALEFAKTASDAGVDAYILQDLGLAAILKQASPILLHASTQMTVHSPAGISAAAKLGFSRVVLARELSLDEIAEIAKTAKALGVELEVFVHGALCMSVSGQCYFSAMLGGRSGNRGLCAQPCRLPYNGENSYPLSLKDLCALDRLSELAALGVCSFKIEGRMKRPEYVAAATAAYRTAADGNTVSNEERGRLERVFSRGGFTDGYLTGKRSDMFGRRDERQKQEERQVLSELHELYRKERQGVPVSMSLRVISEESASLTVDDTAHRVTVFTDPPQPAKSRPLSALTAEERLCKTGDTPYYVTHIECEIEEGLFDPGISELRRRALEELSQLRSKPEIRPFSSDISFSPGLNDAVSTRAPDLRIRFAGYEQMPEALNGAGFVYLPLDVPMYAAERLNEAAVPFGIELPRVIYQGEREAAEKLKIWKERGAKAVLCNTLSGLETAREAKIPAHAGAFMNLLNAESMDFLRRSFGVCDVTCSPELPLREIKKKTPLGISAGIIAYGYLPMMLTRVCPIKNEKDCASCGDLGRLRDRKGVDFYIQCAKEYCEILNSRPLWLADQRDRLAGLDHITLYFTKESGLRCAEVIRAYRDGSRETPESFTRGIYRKGV